MATDQQKLLAAACWKKGNEAVAKENWDYAISMYATAVKSVPDNRMYRESLRGAEHRKYGHNGKGASMAGMRLMTIRTRIKTSRLKKSWLDVDQTAEEGLQINPWDAALNADVGDACRELGYEDVAAFAYEESIKADGTNKVVLESLAKVLEDKGEFQRAAGCYERILKLDPLHPGARSKVMSLNTQKVLERGGYQGAESTQNVMADHEVAKRLRTVTGQGAHSADGPGMSVEADLQRAIRKEPANKDNYLKLADHYRLDGELDKALEQYKQALQASGGDINIRERVEDVELDLMRNHLDVAKGLAAGADDTDKRKQAGDMARELLLREIEVFSSRVERYPNDMRMKYELAQRHMRKQDWTKAIPLYQQARGDTRVKGESLVCLAKCFNYDGKPALARRQYESAIPEVKFEDKPDLYKDLHYSFARLLEDLGDKAAAEEHYQLVLEVDYNYKDTLERLNRLQSGE